MQPRQKRQLLQAAGILTVLGFIYYTYAGAQVNQDALAAVSPSADVGKFGVTPSRPRVAPATSGAKQYLFIFGDSYSSHSHAGFVPATPLQPTDENPTGYLAASTDEGTFSGGDIWVDVFLREAPKGTHVYNYATPGNVVNYTRLGSHFDPTLMAIMSPVRDMVDQLGHFQAIHAEKIPWKSDNSIFFNWFGVNDLTAAQLHSKLPEQGMDQLVRDQAGDFWSLVRRQYRLGARQFVHMLVPPMDRVPSYSDFNPAMKPLAAHLTEVWSTVFRRGNAEFLAEHPDVTSVVFETADVFNEMMDDYKKYGAKNDNCFSYGKDKLCLWYDFLHPAEIIQQQMGKGIYALAEKSFPAFV